MLDSRQAATLFWAIAFIVFSLIVLRRSGSGRGSIGNLMKIFFSAKIIVPVLLVFGWNTGVIIILRRIGYWNATMLWDTITFVCFGAIASLFRAAEAKFDRAFFVRTVVKNASVMFILEFLINWYSLGWWDFILVPLFTLIATLLVVANQDEAYRVIQKFLSGVLGIASLTLLWHAVTLVVIRFREFATVGTLKFALLPFILSIAFVPLLFLLCTWIAYESAFIPLRLAQGMNRWTRWYVKWYIFTMLGFNLLRVQTFRGVTAFELRSAISRADVKRLLTAAEPAA